MAVFALLCSLLCLVFSFSSLCWSFASFCVLKNYERMGLTESKEAEITKRAAIQAAQQIAEKLDERREEAEQRAMELLKQLENLKNQKCNDVH